MSRGNRIALLAAAALVVAVTGTVFATRQPDAAQEPAQLAQDGEDVPPTAEEIAHAGDRLRAANLDVDDALLNELATEYGISGAIRIIAWAADAEANTDVATIRLMRDGTETEPGMGWGKIAKELGVHPGIGSIMGNGQGNGRENAPGQNREEDDASGG